MYPNSNRIRDLDDLEMAVKKHKAVIVPGTVFEKPTSAAFIFMLQGDTILKLIKKGMRIYTKLKRED